MSTNKPLTEAQQVHLLYAKGAPLRNYAEASARSARHILQKSKIAQSLASAITLQYVHERMPITNSIEDAYHRLGMLRILTTDYFSMLADDVLLLSAYEIYAKSQLLKKRYVIHDILKPDGLRKKQRREPIHIRTIQAHFKRGETVEFGETTLAVSTLQKRAYKKITTTPSAASKGLEEVWRRRNLIHFVTIYWGSVTKALIDFVRFLDQVLPRPESATAERRRMARNSRLLAKP
jgi:hypothetical protein